VAHYSLKPVTDLQDKLSKQSIPSDAPEDIHRQQLQEYYKENIAIYTIRAQFASDLSQHSVDDAAVVWPESTSPYYDLGIITFPSQITWTEAKIDWVRLKSNKPCNLSNQLKRSGRRILRYLPSTVLWNTSLWDLSTDYERKYTSRVERCANK